MVWRWSSVELRRTLQRGGASPRNRRTLRSIWGSHRAARHDSQFIITLLCLILILCESFTRWSFHSGTADIRGGDAKVTWLRLLRSRHLRAKQTGFYRNRLNICSSWNYRDTNRKSFKNNQLPTSCSHWAQLSLIRWEDTLTVIQATLRNNDPNSQNTDAELARNRHVYGKTHNTTNNIPET